MFEQAISDFKRLVVAVNGSYTTMSANGSWHRTLQPGQEFSAKNESNERIQIHSGCVDIWINGEVMRFQEGESFFIPKHQSHKVVAGPAGAKIEYKFL